MKHNEHVITYFRFWAWVAEQQKRGLAYLFWRQWYIWEKDDNWPDNVD